ARRVRLPALRRADRPRGPLSLRPLPVPRSHPLPVLGRRARSLAGEPPDGSPDLQLDPRRRRLRAIEDQHVRDEVTHGRTWPSPEGPGDPRPPQQPGRWPPRRGGAEGGAAVAPVDPGPEEPGDGRAVDSAGDDAVGGAG